jgi:hypothetical protein
LNTIKDVPETLPVAKLAFGGKMFAKANWQVVLGSFTFFLALLPTIIAPSYSVAKDETLDRTSSHIRWLQNCSNGRLNAISVDMKIYQIISSDNNSPQKVLGCLFKEKYEKWNDGSYLDFIDGVLKNPDSFAKYDSLVYHDDGFDGGPFGYGEAVGLFDNQLIFLIPTYSQLGIEEALFCRGDFGRDILFTTTNYTVGATYLFNLETNRSSYLGNGTIDKKCGNGDTFLVRGMKSYLSPNDRIVGPAWYDELVSRNGTMFDIATSMFDKDVSCLPWSEFKKQASWDIDYPANWGWFKKFIDFSVCFTR